MAETPGETVSIIVGGQELFGFQDVNVTRESKSASISFALTATNPSWSQSAWSLKKGAQIDMMASGALICRGYIDDYQADYAPGSKTVRVSGRSKSQDMIDCPPAKHKTGRIEKKNLKQAAEEFDEFGVGIESDETLRPIPVIQRDPTETAFQTIERYARSEGLMLIGKTDGGIKITRVGKKRHAGTIRLGESGLTSFNVKFTAKEKPSQVNVRGQSGLGVDDKALRKEQVVYDPSVGRYRPAIVFPEREAADQDVKRRGEWKRLRAHASGVSVTFTIATWRDESGSLWEPGHLLTVICDEERIDQDLSIQSVTFTQNQQGTQANITVVDPKSEGGKGGGGNSNEAYSTRDGDLS